MRAWFCVDLGAFDGAAAREVQPRAVRARAERIRGPGRAGTPPGAAVHARSH